MGLGALGPPNERLSKPRLKFRRASGVVIIAGQDRQGPIATGIWGNFAPEAGHQLVRLNNLFGKMGKPTDAV
jgi:hypothetical protein